MDGVLKRIGVTLISFAALAFLLIGAAAAKETALTQDNVSRFLSSFSQMKMIAVGEGLKASGDSEAAKNPLGAVVKAIKSSKLQTQAKTVAVKNGFADLKDWLETGKAIAQAYAYVTTGPAKGIARDTLDKNKDRAIKELEKLGLVTESQKERLKGHLDNLSEQLAREPPKENVAVVKQMKPDIEAAVNIGLN
jgi:hypothetical protein